MPATTERIMESVGTLLRDARTEMGLSVHEISAKTKIPEKYLAMFENDAHDGLVDDVYTKIYLKAYGKFLGFETSALLDHYRKERARLGVPVRNVDSRTDRHPTKEVENKALVVTPKLLQSVALGLVALGLLGWFGAELKKIVAAPAITVSAPQDGAVTYDRAIAVEGTAERETALMINGKTVIPDASGRFRDELNLQEGLNTITIVGSKKHSKQTEVTRRVIVLPKAEAPLEAGSVLIEEVLPDGAATDAAAPIAPATTAPKPAVKPAPTAAPAAQTSVTVDGTAATTPAANVPDETAPVTDVPPAPTAQPEIVF